MRKFAAIALLIGVLCYPSAARAGVFTAHVENDTNDCAWITLYTAHGFGPWEIAGKGFAPSRETTTFRVNAWNELKIRAEVKLGKACGNTANIADTYDVRRDMHKEQDMTFYAHLVRGDNGRFNLWFKK